MQFVFARSAFALVVALVVVVVGPAMAQDSREATPAAAPDDTAQGALDLRGTLNPDTKHIEGAAGAEKILVLPREGADDYPNLQWAVDNVAAGGTVALGDGTFFLGDGKSSPKQTVRVRQGVTIRGQKVGDAWRSVIRGGGAIAGCGPSLTSIESGPFVVANESDPHPVVFEDVWMREWTAEAVCIVASRGFVFRGNRLSHPVNTVTDGAIRFVHALWTMGSQAQGEFTVENNLVELGGYEGAMADDEQFMGVFYSNHDTVRVVDNVITGIDEAIEIIGNRVDRTAQGEGPPATVPADVIVTGNRIDVTQQPGERWPSTFAILVAGNKGADSVRIEHNEIAVRGMGTGFAFGISGDRFRIADNTVRFETFDGKDPAGVMTIGFGRLAGLPMGTSLNDSVFEGNVFEGSVRDVGILFRTLRGGLVNDSHGNRFDVGESLAGLDAEATLSLSEGVRGNVFVGDLGTVVDESPEGANEFR